MRFSQKTWLKNMYFVRKIILKSANMVNGCKCAMENGDFCGDFGFKKDMIFLLKLNRVSN